MIAVGPNHYSGKLRYWHRKFLPVFEWGYTQETEMPFRFGKTFVIRIPFTYQGFFIGHWVFDPEVDPDDDEQIDKILSEALSVNTLLGKDNLGLSKEPLGRGFAPNA